MIALKWMINDKWMMKRWWMLCNTDWLHFAITDNIELKMMNAIVMNWWNLIDSDEWHAMSVLIVILDDIVWMMINH